MAEKLICVGGPLNGQYVEHQGENFYAFVAPDSKQQIEYLKHKFIIDDRRKAEYYAIRGVTTRQVLDVIGPRKN